MEFEVLEKAPSKTKYLMSTIWFLNQISSQPLAKLIVVGGTNLIKSVDQGWLEHTGGQKLFIIVIYCRKLNVWVQSRAFNYLLRIMVGVLIL